ncbi:MAG: hypothetical protein E7491_09120 [Ruminococcaceae bacterium]|nr:hypothetical protein [Oscillospiraceae bacterium]
MLTTFLATLNPMLMLFFCIAIGFIARKANLLPDNAGKVMAKLETWIFFPALCFSTMATNCTVASLSTHAANIIFSVFGVALAMVMAVFLARFFAEKSSSDRGVYTYALCFANSGYVGDPVVLAMFGDLALSYYKLFCLPISLVIYTWGVSLLVPKNGKKESFFKQILNPPTVAMLLGIIVGISGIGTHIPVFVGDALTSLRSCMGPVAMLLAGFTIAGYDLKQMLTNKKVYIATFLRLTVLPAIIVAFLFGIKMLANLAFDLNIGNTVLFLAFFATAPALGLNTVVFPEAYGGNPKTGAGMALISHTLCVISIPLMYALMVSIFGPFTV